MMTHIQLVPSPSTVITCGTLCNSPEIGLFCPAASSVSRRAMTDQDLLASLAQSMMPQSNLEEMLTVMKIDLQKALHMDSRIDALDNGRECPVLYKGACGINHGAKITDGL
jgi:hypothetical protein